MNLGPKEIADLSIAYSRCMAQLEGQGCRVGVIHDFSRVAEILEERGKEVTPFFQPKFFDFTGHNGFCHIAEIDGDPATFCCSQVFDTGNLSYLEFHRAQLRRVYGDPYPIDTSWTCPPMSTIKGRVIYNGDAFNSLTYRGRNSLRRMTLLARMNLYLSLLSWPDLQASVALAKADHVSKGLGWCYSMAHIYPFATKWINIPPGRRQDDVFLFNSAQDILYHAQVDVISGNTVSEETD